MLKLARLHNAEPTMVSYLVLIAVRGVAIDALARTLEAGSLSTETRKALDDELGRADDPAEFVTMLRGERAVSLDTLDGAMGELSLPQYRMLAWPMQRYFLKDFDFLNRAVEGASGPWETVRAEVRLGGAWTVPTGGGVLADLLVPALAACVEAHTRDVTLVRSLRVLNALQAYAAEHGREASGLADLALPAGATIDLFSGNPLILNHTDAGWIVYGVGKNGVDDGGKLDDATTDVGLGPPAKAKMAAAATN